LVLEAFVGDDAIRSKAALNYRHHAACLFTPACPKRYSEQTCLTFCSIRL